MTRRCYQGCIRTAIPIVVRRFRYNDCIIEILNNKTWSFKYEWVITPISAVAKKACAKYKMNKAHDPTSHKSIEMATYFAKCAVNEIRNPFSHAPWKY